MTLRALATVCLVVALSVLTGCASATEPHVVASPTPIARLNTAAMSLPRMDFCSLVPTSAVSAVLGGHRTGSSTWRNGQRADVTGSGADVVAEHGCSWTGPAGSRARAWVFARPVNRGLARLVVREAGSEKGCRAVHGPRFGDPTMTQRCRVGGAVRVRHAGLFGSTWLSCELQASGPVAAVRHRADAWCVTVANVLNTSR
ncbi:hypothetical protein [Nocardioides terrisoli]|uniref:hypothetical protein n=1 Tax=Nocardioides terrisoli TaxID=3388267 RepID=UPI00287B9164|nr:hypothetical protein [Nocardioides marmorisolisilvae]